MQHPGIRVFQIALLGVILGAGCGGSEGTPTGTGGARASGGSGGTGAGSGGQAGTGTGGAGNHGTGGTGSGGSGGAGAGGIGGGGKGGAAATGGAVGPGTGGSGSGGKAGSGGGGGAGGKGTGGAGTGGSAGHGGGGGAGGKGTGGAAGGGGAGGSGAVPYSAVQAIFDAHCTNCHDATKSGLPTNPEVPLTSDVSYATLVGVPAMETCGGVRVVAGSAASSYLYHKVADTTPCDGMRMPRPFEVGLLVPLSAADIATIQNWINEGAPP